jgi:hypothetical protein
MLALAQQKYKASALQCSAHCNTCPRSDPPEVCLKEGHVHPNKCNLSFSYKRPWETTGETWPYLKWQRKNKVEGDKGGKEKNRGDEPI